MNVRGQITLYIILGIVILVVIGIVFFLKSNIINSLLNQEQQKIKEHLNDIEKRLKRSMQSVETIRFNPFKGTGDGGNQSFSTSFLNENGDGVVISSLYSRDRISLFSKPLSKFESNFELTGEEKGVIKEAKGKLG